MKYKLFGCILVCAMCLTSCDLLQETDTVSGTDDIVKGLKTALEVGTDSAVTITSASNGYLKDEAIKILLPPEAQIIANNINLIPGGDVLLDKLVTLMNRSAEDAAQSATPILKKSITSLSITDGLSILNGTNPGKQLKSTGVFDSTAATQYLISNTYDDLATAFAIPINISLDKPLLGNLTTNTAWTDLTGAYNKVVDLDVFNLLGLHKVNVNLSKYVTGKALDGLFVKVGEQERDIRRNPWKWVTDAVGDILTKVFGK